LGSQRFEHHLRRRQATALRAAGRTDGDIDHVLAEAELEVIAYCEVNAGRRPAREITFQLSWAETVGPGCEG
jgi:hypothetical protein